MLGRELFTVLPVSGAKSVMPGGSVATDTVVWDSACGASAPCAFKWPKIGASVKFTPRGITYDPVYCPGAVSVIVRFWTYGPTSKAARPPGVPRMVTYKVSQIGR